MRQTVNVFVSYAHANSKLAHRLCDNLRELLRPAKGVSIELWSDRALDAGVQWQQEIFAARNKSSLGLMLVSPAFLGSKFIVEHELPFFVGENAKPMIPLMLSDIDFERHDLHGLADYQIFRLQDDKFVQPRSYSDLKPKRRAQFEQQVFQLIYDRVRTLQTDH